MSQPPETFRPRRVELGLSAAGLAALPLALVALLVGWALGGTVALLAATVLSLFASAFVLGWLAARRVELGPPAPARAFAGEPLVLSLPVRNASRRFTARDLVLTPGPERRSAPRPCGHVDVLAPGACERTLVGLRAGERGVVERLQLAVSSAHPFGLVRATLRFELPVELVVYPRLGSLAELGPLPTPTSAAAAARARPAAGDEELHGVREWREGESLRRVHWGLTARRGRAIVRELRRPSDPPLRVLLVTALELRQGGDARRRAFEAAVSLAATACEQHLRRNRALLLVVGDGGGGGGWTSAELAGRRGLAQALELLARVEPAQGDAAAALAEGLARAGAGLPTLAVFAGRSARVAPGLRRRGELALLDVDAPRLDAVFQRARAFGAPPLAGQQVGGPA